MKELIIGIMLCFTITTFAQNKNKLSFDFGYGINYIQMENINQFYIDSFAFKYKLLDTKIEKSKQFYVNLKYQPTQLFDVGIYGSYYIADAYGEGEFTEVDLITYEPIAIHKSDFVLRTSLISVGFSNSWYISKMLNFEQKNSYFLKRFRIATEFNFGIGYSKTITDFKYPTFKESFPYDIFTSQDFDFQIALKLEYDIIQSPLISTIGFKVGYKQLKTKPLKNKYNDDWVAHWLTVDKEINLDFSGYFWSVYLSIGR